MSVSASPETPDLSAFGNADGIPLLTLSESGEAPKARLTKASTLRAIFIKFHEADIRNARHRAQTQDLLDGGTPYDDQELKDAGQPDTTNLNFGGAEQQLERAMAPYYKLIQSPEKLVSVQTLYGAEENRGLWNSILDEEITRTIRRSEWFSAQTQIFIKKFVWDGVGFSHWPDELDWRYRGAGLGQFYTPRQTLPCEGELEIICAVEEYNVTRLFKAIENEETATANGWDVEAVKAAIRKATTALPAYQDWEFFTNAVKNNDLQINNDTPVVRVINGWVREFSGKVGHYLTTEVAGGTTQESSDTFLYCAPAKYNSMQEALVIFPFGMGTNSKTHGIRGLGYKIYAFEQQRNRSLSRLIDQGDLASSLMVQSDSEENLSSIGLQYYGNLAVIPPNAKVVQYAAPDLQRTVMPVLEEMERLRNDRVAGYTTQNVFDGDQRKTKGEIDAHLEQSASLSDSSLDLFYAPFERLLQQTVRRMCRRTYVPMDPGGPEIAALHLRLVKRGVPLEALFMLDIMATSVVRAIGAGSAAAKTVAYSRLNDLRPRMDDVGQANLDWDQAVDAVGVTNASRYFSKDMVPRTTLDTSIAILQNAQLVSGVDVPVLPSDRHLAHANEHIKPLMDAFQAEGQGQIPIDQMALQFRLLYQHCAQHVEHITGDPAALQQGAQLRQMLQQIGEVIDNGLKKAQADQAKQQEAAAQAAQQGQQPGQPAQSGQPDPNSPPSDQGQAPQLSQDDIAAFEKHKATMAFDQEKHQLKIQQMIEEASTRRAIADADAAARIARGGVAK